MSNKLAKRTITMLVPLKADKQTRSRMGMFTAWLERTRSDWKSPDLAAYRDYLLERYSRASAAAHLSTIRGQYRRIITDNATRETLYALAPTDASPSDKKAFVDEVLIRLENAINPSHSKVTQITHQDRPDAAHIRLSRKQAEYLLTAPGVDTLQGLRDTAIIALLLCTGIREAELCALDVEDLRQELGGELALHVRQGKGCKERLIPYGDLDWCLVVVDAWLKAAGISEGAAFRGYHEGFKVQRGRLSVRAVEYIIRSYPICGNGQKMTAAPHDLRRTYARRLYEAGTPMLAIQQNLGHASSRTTQGYIGALDAATRRPGAIYSFDLSKLQD
jgi:site-specific recombinase XerC